MARARIPTAIDIMQRRLHTVRPDDEIEQAVRLLVKKGHSGAPVVDEAGRLRGVLSEHDCIQVLARAVQSGWPAGPVESQMTREVEIVAPDEDVFALAARFADGRHRRLLVVERERLLGVISRGDLLRTLEKLEKAAAHPPKKSKSTYELIDERHRSRS